MTRPDIDRKQNLWLAGVTGVVLATLVVVAALVGRPVPPPVAVAPAPEPVVVGDDGVKHFGGWVKDDAEIAVNVDPVRTLQFAATPAGQVVRGDEDVFLWQAVRKVNNRGPPWYPNVNQEDVGCCVGCGNKHGADVAQAIQILAGRSAEWKPIAVESIYGPSRVEIGGGRIRGDGSVGAWAVKAMERFGTLPMEKFPGHDLTEFSPERCREWGRTGMPDALEPTARDHPVKGAALVKTWSDVKRSVQQGYPVVVCSDQGFTMARDRDGFCRPSGTWMHCMVIIGYRKDRDAAFILNSWGDRAHTGPVWPSDAPVAGFWADSRTIARMVSQGDSFALSDIVGFPARNLPEFFIQAPAPRPNEVFTRVNRPAGRDMFALAW